MLLRARGRVEIDYKSTSGNIFKQSKLFQDERKSLKGSESFINKSD